MQDLLKQEQFELEVLERFNSAKLLGNLVFCGGTMLRLCCGLNRYSVDLDFWVIKEVDFEALFNKIQTLLEKEYTILDSANKFYTILFEIKSNQYPRGLKIDIRKEKKPIKTESMIAYSKNSSVQVFLTAASLPEMMRAKIEAFLDRKEIRDVFDMEFLLKKGIAIDASAEVRAKIQALIGALSKNDYAVKLGSLLAPAERQYYTKENFKILKAALDVENV